MTTTIDHWADRVDGGDWDHVTEELNEYGGRCCRGYSPCFRCRS